MKESKIIEAKKDVFQLLDEGWALRLKYWNYGVYIQLNPITKVLERIDENEETREEHKLSSREEYALSWERLFQTLKIKTND